MSTWGIEPRMGLEVDRGSAADHYTMLLPNSGRNTVVVERDGGVWV